MAQIRLLHLGAHRKSVFCRERESERRAKKSAEISQQHANISNEVRDRHTEAEALGGARGRLGPLRLRATPARIAGVGLGTNRGALSSSDEASQPASLPASLGVQHSQSVCRAACSRSLLLLSSLWHTMGGAVAWCGVDCGAASST
ncbi:Hypothetical predicted protein [Cloeon dipterum]|uniref:Uncharacterized protein n=1 Tax=Cloeon dipterum TaxID=197152 RepID=A0A8S1D0V2_9INSE|nr:Hypothetical predicted protein [Cloeon dipterum]